MLHNHYHISFDNINFDKYIQDQYLYNKRQQLNYTTGYICLIDTNINTQSVNASVKAISSN